MEARQIAVDPAEQLQVHEQLVHRRVADALADAERAGVHAVRAGLERPQRVRHAEAAILVPVPVDLDARVELGDEPAHEAHEVAHAVRRRVADGVADADAAARRRGSPSCTAGGCGRDAPASCPR